MHTYRRADRRSACPSLTDMVLTRTGDAVEWADRFVGFTVEHNMAVWHLGEDGRMTCSTKGCTWASIEQWIRRPWQLDFMTQPDPRTGTCGRDWLIVAWRPGAAAGGDPVPTEGDLQRFGLLRDLFGIHGVRLVDTLVLGDDRWWSLRELATGSTEW